MRDLRLPASVTTRPPVGVARLVATLVSLATLLFAQATSAAPASTAPALPASGPAAASLDAAAMAALYVFEERRLKRRDAGVLRLRLPSLEALDRLAARATLVGLSHLTAGLAVGLGWLDVGGIDSAMTVAVLIWVV